MADYLIRILTQDGKIRLSVAVTTLLVRELQRLQHTDPTASVALGRIATAAALLGSLIKGDQRVALSIEGNGPLKKLQAESDAQGHIRATVCPDLGSPLHGELKGLRLDPAEFSLKA